MRHVDREYLRDLHIAIDLMTTAAEEEIGTNSKVATKAQIGVQTLINLRTHKTRLPQHYTLVKLARATGFHIEFKRGIVNLRNALRARKKRKTG